MSIPISITVEGANILTRNLIIFGQGAIRCHPYLLKEIELISATDTKVNELDKVLLSHIGYFVSNLIRTFGYGVTGGKLILSKIRESRIRKYHKQLTRMSVALALLADASAILLGGTLKRRERISARLGDLMSQLYLASAVLKYYIDNNQPNDDVDYVCWCLQTCLYKMQIAIDEVTANFPNLILGGLLRFLVFPFGCSYKMPTDQLHEKLLIPMLKPSSLRDRLSRYAFLSQHESDLQCRLEKALAMQSLVEPIWKKIQTAVHDGSISKQALTHDRVRLAETAKMITSDEAQLLNEYEALKDEIIKVNEFSFDLSEVIA